MRNNEKTYDMSEAQKKYPSGTKKNKEKTG